MSLYECDKIGTHWTTIYVDNVKMTYFDSFGVEHIAKDIKSFIANRHITASIFRIQACDQNIFDFLFSC